MSSEEGGCELRGGRGVVSSGEGVVSSEEGGCELRGGGL